MNRSDWIDSCKGIVILLMVIGHVPHLPDIVIKLIYGFHMPFFFIMSGYLFNQDKWHSLGFRQFASTRMKNYLIPFFFWATIIWIIASIWYASSHSINETVNQSLAWLWGNIYADGRMAHMPYDGPLWFLPCLFIASLLFYLVTILNNQYLGSAILGGAFIWSFLLKHYNIPQLPWHINGMGYYCFLMWVGLQIKRYNLLEKMKTSIVFLLLVVGIFAIIINSPVDLNLCNVSNPLLFLFGAIPISVACMFSCKQQMSNKFFSLFGIGKNSMVCLAFNFLIIKVMENILVYGVINNYLYVLINIVVEALVCMLLIYGMIYIRKTSKLKLFEYV